MSIVYRLGGPLDAEAASRLAQRAKANWGYPSEWLLIWREALTIKAEYLERHWSVVAVDHEALVGICVLEAHHDKAEIGHLWISPEHQRRGIGRTLIHRALRTAQMNGYTQVRVESDPFAEAFYVRLGARRVGSVSAPMPGMDQRELPVLSFAGPDDPLGAV
ncbi:MAG: GNAT family N-acetyltransferase [Vicinamibacterales bacterium]